MTHVKLTSETWLGHNFLIASSGCFSAFLLFYLNLKESECLSTLNWSAKTCLWLSCVCFLTNNLRRNLKKLNFIKDLCENPDFLADASLFISSLLFHLWATGDVRINREGSDLSKCCKSKQTHRSLKVSFDKGTWCMSKHRWLLVNGLKSHKSLCKHN